jgi:regulator of cell morphogenesis and NO signaling
MRFGENEDQTIAMSNDSLETSIVDWVIDHPESIAVFQKHGIDYCCAGKSLEYACRQAGVEPEFVLVELRRACGQNCKNH